MRLDDDKKRLHLVLLRVRDDPFPAVAGLIDLLEIITRPKDDLLLLALREKLRGRRPENLDQIEKRLDGW